MALAWNAGWVNALRGSNPLSSAREVPDQFWSGTFSLPRSAAEPRYCRRMLPSTTGRLIAGGTGLALSAFVDAPLKKWMPRNRTSSYAIGLMVAAAVYPVARQGRTRLRHTVDVSIPTREWSAVAATFAVFVGALLVLTDAFGNDGLWAALHVFLLVRGVSLSLVLKRRMRKF